jgi:pyridoxamine 5'-phosphate oxidase
VESLGKHTDYGQSELLEAHLPPSPFEAFSAWLKAAEAGGIYEPNAFVLGTIDASGAPNARTVLLKELRNGEFFFATNYSSQKGQELAKHSAVSMLFGWYAIHRQVRVLGNVRLATRQESNEYFQSRPHGSQLASMISEQSAPISSRQGLEARFTEAQHEFAGTKVPTPDHWGGYWIKPHRIEFWQGRSNRLHDRIDYQLRPDGSWTSQRLQP